jgi:putative transposase
LSYLLTCESGDFLRRPKKDNEIADWILKIREENPQWESRKICDCLVNLGFEVCRTTVRNVLLLNGYDPEPNTKSTWKQFLRSHWNVLVACDFFSVELLTQKGIVRCMVLFATELPTRKVEILGVTSDPNGLLIKQVARNATEFEHDMFEQFGECPCIQNLCDYYKKLEDFCESMK